jgi:phenol hydroxylase P0 protein
VPAAVTTARSPRLDGRPARSRHPAGRFGHREYPHDRQAVVFRLHRKSSAIYIFLEILVDIEFRAADNRSQEEGGLPGTHSIIQGGSAVARSIRDGDGVRRDDLMQARVRILGTRLGRFVEFEYALGDGDLAVELILPTIAFEEFCKARSAVVLPPDTATAEAVEQLAWRAGHPGLLQRTARDDSN